MWDGNPRRVAVDAVDTDSLLGMSMLRGHELVMKVVKNGKVEISSLP